MARIVDLRSDTLTRPTAAMREAMARAEVGDDVFGEDPTVNRLQEKVAELLGKEAAIFVPSGTMSNLIGVLLHCARGDELICETGCHIYNYEQGGYAQIGGIAARTVTGQNGVLTVDQLEGLIRPENDHMVRTRLVCLENTHNRGGGTIQPYENVEAICAWAREHDLKTHLDGARLWNAAVATGIPPREWARHFDTVSVCFSKGLGAPVGSCLTGPAADIARARRWRKVLGGGMRQAGILAAAALYAVENHIERLAEDHANARRLGEAIAAVDGLRLIGERVETNIVIFEVSPSLGTAPQFVARLADCGVLALPVANDRVRLVTHLDVSAPDISHAIDALMRTAETCRNA
ncbi:low-specificity L-threonine aldolase [Thermostilla marina]